MVLNIGLPEIVGELIGENQDFSESECILTILVFNKIVLGEQLKIKLIGLI